MIVLMLYPFSFICPKCARIAIVELTWCRGCDDQLETEHLHITCACSHRRVTQCADAPRAAPPATSAETKSEQPPEVTP